MPSFIDANNLQPFIDDDLKGVLNKFDFISKNGKEDSGYNALILPKLCKVYLDARQEKVLKSQQLPLAIASEILVIGSTILVLSSLGHLNGQSVIGIINISR